MPQIHVKTQTTSTQMGLSLINKIKNFGKKLSFPNPTQK